MSEEGTKHDLTYIKGTDARNHIVKCSCGFAASDTYLSVRKRGQYHIEQKNPLRWDDPRREYQSDRYYPPFRGYLV